MDKVMGDIAKSILPYTETLSAKEQKKIKSKVNARIIQDRKSIVMVMMNVMQGSVPTLLRGCSSDDCCEMWQTISREYEEVGDFAVVMSFRLSHYRAPTTMPVALVYRLFDDGFRLMEEQGETFSDRLKSGMFLDSLPKQYENIITAILAQGGKLIWKSIADRMLMTKGLTGRSTASGTSRASSVNQGPIMDKKKKETTKQKVYTRVVEPPQQRNQVLANVITATRQRTPRTWRGPVIPNAQDAAQQQDGPPSCAESTTRKLHREVRSRYIKALKKKQMMAKKEQPSHGWGESGASTLAQKLRKKYDKNLKCGQRRKLTHCVMRYSRKMA